MTSHTSLGDSGQATRRPAAPSPETVTVTRLGGAGRQLPQQVPMASVQGTLALDIRGSLGLPRTPDLRVVDDNGRVVDEVRMWSARFAQAVVEVVGGDRPLTQLVRWTTDRVYADLGRRVRILARTSPCAQRLRTVRPQVRSVHVFQPTPQSAEVSVHVRYGRRSRALAARLELDDGRWQCTALELG